MLDKQTALKHSLIQKPLDKCGFYAETNLQNFPVEPISALSNIIFLFILIYWIWKTKCKIKLYPLIVISIPLMLLSLIFDTMFHLLRNDVIWHQLNLLCTVYAVIMASVYLWRRITGKWLYTFIFSLGMPILFQIFIAYTRPIDKLSLNVVFVVMALSIFIPAMIYCIRNKTQFIISLIISSSCFLLGIYFRTLDEKLIDKSSIGTLFLWHIFCALSIFYFLKFSFNSDRMKTVDKFNEIASSF